jgi:hypothetical protein
MLRRRLGQGLFGAAIFGRVSGVRADPGLGRVEIGGLAPDFALPGADGRSHALSDFHGRIVVLEWTSPVCPYTAIKYRHGFMQAIQARAARAGAAWMSINTSSPGKPGYLTPDAARARTGALHARISAFLFDESGRVGRAYGVRVTPTVVVIGPDGRLACQGGVDETPEVDHDTHADRVTLAIDAIGRGQAVASPETRAYGCALEY